MTWALIAIGSVLVVLGFLLAFTIYGEIALVVGLGCVVLGTWLTGARASGRGDGTIG